MTQEVSVGGRGKGNEKTLSLPLGLGSRDKDKEFWDGIIWERQGSGREVPESQGRC